MATSRQVFQETLPGLRVLLADPRLAARWNEPSALAEFSMRGLAGHLARATITVETYLDEPAPVAGAPINAAGYVLAVSNGPDFANLASPLQQSIRQRGEAAASHGPAGLLAEFDRGVGRLTDRLAKEPPDRRIAVFGGLVITLDEYLLTRLLEAIVHADDLAVSLGVPLPELPPAALEFAGHLLIEVARRRHGQLAVLRALARRERDTVAALRVI